MDEVLGQPDRGPVGHLLQNSGEFLQRLALQLGLGYQLAKVAAASW